MYNLTKAFDFNNIKLMKGVLLCGGSGSRLLPLTSVTNKHLLPIGNKPMIFYSIDKFKEIDISDIMSNGVNFTYRVQDKPLGIAHAIGLTEDFVGKNEFLVILGDNIFEFNMVKIKKQFMENIKSIIILNKNSEPHRFGVAEIKNNKLMKIVEKPKNPSSDLIVTGVYYYKPDIYAYIRKLVLSERNEYEITDLHNMLIADGKLDYIIEDSYWSDAGTFKTYFEVNKKYGKI
jgi:glucose-1-phosphate thymidylyltransferase